MKNMKKIDKKESKKKSSKVISIVIYALVGVICICSGISIFNNLYYDKIVVTGQSMYPTLNYDSKNNSDEFTYRHELGLVNSHKKTLDKIKRFDIVSLYYPSDYTDVSTLTLSSSAYKKIKRVYAFENETISFVKEVSNEDQNRINTLKSTVADYLHNEEYQTIASRSVKVYVGNTPSSLEEVNINFKRFIDLDTFTDYSKTLGENEIWVEGDNYTNSKDSSSGIGTLYKSFITGKLVYIIGTCKLKSSFDRTSDISDSIYDIKYSWFKRV